MYCYRHQSPGDGASLSIKTFQKGKFLLINSANPGRLHNHDLRYGNWMMDERVLFHLNLFVNKFLLQTQFFFALIL